MPIHEYRCQACGDEFEVIQKVSDPPLRKCEKCGGSLEKLLSRSAFVLKGSGWYADGYGKGGSGATSRKSGAGDKKPAGGAASGTTAPPSSGSN